jgi:hypothetical protein
MIKDKIPVHAVNPELAIVDVRPKPKRPRISRPLSETL